ncbi:hypothetical protein FH972_000151 [Carpinus fangiana]|uniref:PGG domain-containing protein n=1 Tax=Carpinus fangiana TaxID=176857 RepID=A0A5N6Q7Y6_9ROSI|nr:hypothetical protein FH972_000151 [Carpinus fangiana]
MKGDWKGMESFYNKYPDRLLDPLTIEKDTPFHIAAYSERTEQLRHFLGLLKEPTKIFAALSKQNSHGNNTFHEVATTGNIEAADLLISKLQETELKTLLEARNQLGETPVYRAGALGQSFLLKYFAKRVGNLSDHFHRSDTMSILHIAVIGQHFITGAWLLVKDKELGTRKGLNDMTCLDLLAKMRSAFKSSSRLGQMKTLFYDCLPSHYHEDYEEEAQTILSRIEDLESGKGTRTLLQFNEHTSAISRINCAIWSGLAKEWPVIDKIWQMKRRHIAALRLTKSLVKMDTTWANSFVVPDKTISLGKADCLDDGVNKREKELQSKTIEGGSKKELRSNYTPLLIAASEGIVEIVNEILLVYPQAIEHVTKDEENILHVAIKYRQMEIFRLVKKMKIIRDCRLVSRIDNRGYTILHHVADTEKYDGGTKAGPALQLQAELKWLERVRKIMPSHYVMHRNNDGKTADELFKDTHAALLKKAQKWIKETSQSCSAVAVLVATVVFAAAYTVPGGNDELGRPVFLHSPFFLFFTIMDVVSLASSLTSVVMFLSILTSPFEQENFFRSLPRKLILGFTLLFFSVTTTMLSFTATILLIIRLEKKTWTTTLIYTAAFFPVSVFALMQFPLYLAFTSCLHSLLKKLIKKVPRFFKSAVRRRSIQT